MRSTTTKFVLIVGFIALLGAVYLLDGQSGGSGPEGVIDEQSALQRYGFYLEEVSGQAGVTFSHQPPVLDDKLSHIMPQIASVGASVSVGDFNNDGLADFYTTSSRRGTKNALYKNQGNGQFTNVAEPMGVAALNDSTGASMGSVWADYNNDGFEDLLVYRWGKLALFRNESGNGFTEVSAQMPFPERINANTAVWFDYNRDGLIDLFVGGYFNESIDLWNLTDTQIMPESFEYATNGGRKYLFKNNGNGSFTEVSNTVGLQSNRWSMAASAADITGNGYPDLIIANDYGVDELFINESGKRFRSAGDNAGMGFAPKSGMNVTYGDVLNQGRPAVYITNISEPGVLIQGNNLWVPQAKGGASAAINFVNMAGDMDIELGGWSYGAQFGDLNNDGFLDLYVANGYVSGKEGSDYWYDFSKVAGGNRAIIGDAQNWPPMEGRSLSGYQQNNLWLNDGAGRFREVSSAVGGALVADSRSVALADIDNNGTLDLIVASQGGALRIYKNTVRDNEHWVQFNLRPTESNASAIGATMRVYWNGQQQLQTVSGGSGFSSQNQRRLHVGLGQSTHIDSASVQWPSGQSTMLYDVKADSMYTIKE